MKTVCGTLKRSFHRSVRLWFLVVVWLCCGVTAFVAGVGGGIALAAPRRRAGPHPTASATPVAAAQLTTLRAEAPRVLMAGKPGQLETRLISVNVRNAGSVTARQVTVAVEVDGGVAVPLRGPKTLPPHAAAVYVTTVRMAGVFARAPRVRILCEPCRHHPAS